MQLGHHAADDLSYQQELPLQARPEIGDRDRMGEQNALQRARGDMRL